MRLYIYYQIFDKLKPITYRVYLYGTITYIAIIAVYSIPTTILQHQLAVEYDYTYRVCRYGVVFTEMAFTLAWIGCISVLVLAFLARHINTSFNEYRKILLICLLCILTLVYQTVVHNVFRKYIIARWARLTTVLIEYLSSQASLFILLGTPAYNCLFHREKYREKWFAKMRADNLVSKYGFDVDTPYTGASDLQVSETTAV
ncbi:hypothetical protein LPJ66_001828 [Kickxella alabastrina]|uniref:Uncharacterized protein n=1 Tax=Kickxella alabastrina TaxID=61397 RepID=A0ACC1IS74_9FUNG|nr:hypothetical protein LPJ66_001828 [Kickxella alabastrina]